MLVFVIFSFIYSNNSHIFNFDLSCIECLPYHMLSEKADFCRKLNCGRHQNWNLRFFWNIKFHLGNINSSIDYQKNLIKAIWIISFGNRKISLQRFAIVPTTDKPLPQATQARTLYWISFFFFHFFVYFEK